VLAHSNKRGVYSTLVVAASFAVASLALATCALIALAPKKLAASIFLPAGFDDACVCGRVLEVDVSGMVWRPRGSVKARVAHEGDAAE
jgi:hypothetical protein